MCEAEALFAYAKDPIAKTIGNATNALTLIPNRTKFVLVFMWSKFYKENEDLMKELGAISIGLLYASSFYFVYSILPKEKLINLVNTKPNCTALGTVRASTSIFKAISKADSEKNMSDLKKAAEMLGGDTLFLTKNYMTLDKTYYGEYRLEGEAFFCDPDKRDPDYVKLNLSY